MDVGKIVAAGASRDPQVQQNFNEYLQQVQYQSVTDNRFQHIFNEHRNVVRDQGVGGSNPLSSTIYFQ